MTDAGGARSGSCSCAPGTRPQRDGRGAPAPARRRRLRGPQRGHATRRAQPADAAHPGRGRHRRLVGALEVRRRVPRPAVRLRRSRCATRRARSARCFPGGDESLHWGYEDPAEATGTDEERMAVFRRVFIQPGERINQFIPLAPRSTRPPGDAATPAAERLRSAGRDRAVPAAPRARRRSARRARGPTRRGRCREGRAAGGTARAFLAGVGFIPDAIITSPKVRAARTAEMVARHLGLPVGMTRGWARRSSRMSSTPSCRGRRPGPARPRRPRPGLQRAGRLLCGASHLPMRKGAMLRIDIDRPLRAGVGTLRWLVPPDLL